jgi:protein transport protein SEC24
VLPLFPWLWWRFHHLQACVELLKPTGGKVHAFITGLPNAGSRALKMRDGNATLAEKEKQMGLLPQDMTYLTLAAQAADFNVRGVAFCVLGLSGADMTHRKCAFMRGCLEVAETQ